MPYIVPSSRIRPADLGVQDNKLRPCPSSPNCVSSQTEVSSAFVAPLRYAPGQRTEFRRLLLDAIRSDQRNEIVTETDRYIHYEARAFVFIDDVELLFSEEAPIVHIRSASRSGYSDLGANARRVAKLSSELQKATRGSKAAAAR